jgi:replication fork clamp-binding protein CrfC
MAKQIKLKELYDECKKQMALGNGEKFLVVSDDNEGNGFHGMFFTVSAIRKKDRKYYESLIRDSCETNADNILLVG